MFLNHVSIANLSRHSTNHFEYVTQWLYNFVLDTARHEDEALSIIVPDRADVVDVQIEPTH